MPDDKTDVIKLNSQNRGAARDKIPFFIGEIEVETVRKEIRTAGITGMEWGIRRFHCWFFMI